MAYDQTPRRASASGSHENEEHRRRTSFVPTVICDGGSEQARRITSPLFRPGVNTQRWPPVPTYIQPNGAYDPSSGYQQPLSPVNNTVGSSTYQYHASAVAVSQSATVPSSGYTAPLPYANPHHHETACSTASYPMNQGYTTLEAAHVSLSPSSATSGYQSLQYSYEPRTGSVSTALPDFRYLIPLVRAPERSPIDAEYSVPCPYRCGTVLTGVHALGNLTRHLKTQACAGSSRTKVRYPCPISGCERQYARSDGLRVHMRRRHGAPPPVSRTDGAADDDED